MTRVLRSTRGRLLLVGLVLIAMLAAFPLSAAFRLFGLDRMGVAAKSLRGPVWWGGAEELEIGGIRLGTVAVFLDPLKLLFGQVRVDVARITGGLDDLTGGVTLGFGTRAIDDVTGAVPLAAVLAPLPVSRVEFEKFSVHFTGDACVKAEGNVRVRVPALAGGLNFANGFSGPARCEGGALLLPLVSQSGQERIEARVFADGRYDATMRIKTSDPVLGGALAANGFHAVNGDQVLRVTGRL